MRLLTSLILVLAGCSGADQQNDGGGTLDKIVDQVVSTDTPKGDAAKGDAVKGPCGGVVLTGEVTNARDLGGHLLSQNKTIACRTIMRGGDLCSLGSTGCSELGTLGIKTVVDLRASAVQASQPPASCVSAKQIDAAMPKLPPTTANYLALVSEHAAVKAAFTALGDASGYPVYIHCVIGRDRASFMTALVLMALGADRATVVKEFELSNQAGVTVDAAWITAVVDEIEKQGGIEAYLTTAGVAAADLATLRQVGAK